MVIEQIEWLMKWEPPGLNKFSGLAIPQDAGLPGRLMSWAMGWPLGYGIMK